MNTFFIFYYTGSALPSRKTILQDDFPNQNQQQQQKPLSVVSRQQQRSRRNPLPQFRPQPLELPPLPPSLSVAITAVACPWWTVLDGKHN